MSRKRFTTIITAASAVFVALQTYLGSQLDADASVEGLILIIVGAATVSISALAAWTQITNV